MTTRTDPSTAHRLIPIDDDGVRHELSGVEVRDGDTLEVRTDTGWVSGHYRQRVHPDTGGIAFEMHVLVGDAANEHVTVYVAQDATFRWPANR